MTSQSEAVRQNVFYSVLDYASQPALMIVAAPLLLRALGVQQYGTWMLVNSIAATASGLGGGFGDGATKYISMYRGCGDRHGAVRSLLAVLVVNCGLGLLAAAAMVACAPWLISHVFSVEPNLREAAVSALRVSALLLVVRFAEAVFASAIRGCERYRPVVLISLIARTLVVVSAVLVALKGHGVVAILWMTLAVGIVSLAAQASLTYSVLGAADIWRQMEIRRGISEVFSFGAFTWLKSTLGVLIGYADRLLVAALLGTGPLAFYTLCNQLTQPIHALIASAFNFIFPNFSAQSAAGRWTETKRSYHMATRISMALVIAISLVMILGARLILRFWLGATFAEQNHGLLVSMIIGNGLLALSVVPHYAALALGRSRALVGVNFVAGVVSLGCGCLLIQRVGLIGAGLGKIVAGVAFLSVFSIVRYAFRKEEHAHQFGERSAATASALDFAQ